MFQELKTRFASAADDISSRSPLSAMPLDRSTTADKLNQPRSSVLGRPRGINIAPPSPSSSNPNFNVDDLFGSPASSPVTRGNRLIASTIGSAATNQQREYSMFNFATTAQRQQMGNRDKTIQQPQPAPYDQAAIHSPSQDNMIKLNASSGSYTPSYTPVNPKSANTSLRNLSLASKQSGEGLADYNPLRMRGPGANIFKGTCKWYNSQRGFGFIIPVSFHLSLWLVSSRLVILLRNSCSL